MRREGPVGCFCERLWKLRQQRQAITRELGRELALATAQEVEQDRDYHPEDDRRVLWARAVMESAWHGDAVPQAPLRLEAAMEFMREPVGQLLAAGGPDA